MIFSYIVCSVPVAPIRTAPAQSFEMSSQLLFGEKAIVLKQEGDWLYIECDWDHYEGWVNRGAVQFISFKQYTKSLKSLTGLGSNNKLLQENGQTLLSTGSSLFDLKSGKFSWLQNDAIKYKGNKILLKNADTSTENITKIAQSFLGSPYVWGGRNIMGIDCSGFSQIVYKLLNIQLPRNAAQQALKGETVGFLQEAICGDLAFFDDNEGNIMHVGIMLNNQSVIHASQKSGSVVIDPIDQGGIISKKLKKRTGNLRIIKRYF